MSGGVNPGIPVILGALADPIPSMAGPWWIAIGCFAAIVGLVTLLFAIGVIA
jgi:hypothetical protein